MTPQLLRIGTMAALLALPLSTAVAETVVYVPLRSAGQVLVINPESDEIIDRITDVSEVHGLAGTPELTRLVAGSYSETERSVEGTPPRPSGMATADDEARHTKSTSADVSSGDVVSFVSILDPDDGSIVRRIEVPGAVHHTAITPDGRYALATHPNRDSISVIDLSAFAVARTISTGELPNYAAITSDSRLAYVSNAGDNTISEIDLLQGSATRSFLVGAAPEHIVLSHDADTLYVANAEDGTVSEVRLSDGSTDRVFTISGTLHGIDLSDDEETLYVSGQEANTLATIDLFTGDVDSVLLAPAPYHLTNIEGRGKIYVSSESENKIWVMDADSLHVLAELQVEERFPQMVVGTR